MDSSLVGLIGVIVVVLIAEGVGVCLRRPPGLLLQAEKGVERSDFWSAYIRVVLLLVPASFALVSFPTAVRLDPVLAIVEQLRWGLAGLLIALAVAGKALRVPAPATYSPASFVPPIVPPAASGSAR
ncbi:MAG: hypothetical protein WAQ52_04220 [Terriglobales bacterium]